MKARMDVQASGKKIFSLLVVYLGKPFRLNGYYPTVTTSGFGLAHCAFECQQRGRLQTGSFFPAQLESGPPPLCPDLFQEWTEADSLG
jgi:hypothetical protein